MNKIKSLLYLTISLSINFSFAQLTENYEKGSIIQNNDIKIDGYIRIDDLAKLSSEVCFKLSETDKNCIKYNTKQIKSFSTENERFFDLLTIKDSENNQEIEIFANLILKGGASLYKSVYKGNDIYVIVNQNKNYVLRDDELVFGETKMTTYNYIGILNIATEGFLNIKYSNNAIKFDQKDFTKLVTEYNTSKGFENKIVIPKEKKTSYILVNIGGGFKSDEKEFFAQGIYRMYYPNISKGISLNIGVNYFNYQYSVLNKRKLHKTTQTLTSIPAYVQQNFLNKKFRPYILGGISLGYLKVVTDDISVLEDGLNNNFGVGFLYGAGAELDIYNGFMIKCEYRYETFPHLFLFGIGYNFLK